MVTFICDGCSTTLRKNQVDLHANRCRQCASVSCVDCSVAFYGDDYRSHTTCMTESERYEGKFAKSKQSNKRNPQQEWMDIVTSCESTCPPNLKHYMQAMAALDNIPRKEKQFRNFTANSLSLRGNNEGVVGEIWNILKVEREKRQAVKAQQLLKQKEQKEEAAAKKAREEPKEDKAGDSSSDGSDDDSSTKSIEIVVDAKKVQKALKKELKKAPNQSMKIKVLRKVIRTKLGLPKKSGRRLKELLLQAPNSSKKANIKVDGKMITLL